MANLGLVLLIFAFVCATLSCLSFTEPYRIRLIGACLAFWTAAEIFGGLQRFIH